MKQEDFNFVLSRFVAERLLFRMGVSEHASDFVLKGALLFFPDLVETPISPNA